MSRNGSGTYSLPSGNPVTTGTTISSTTHNNTMSDIASALTASVAKDGQTTMTADLPMGGFKLTNLAAGSASTDSVRMSQLQAGTGVYVGTVGGTADVITLTPSPAITAYAAGQRFSFIASGANTTAVTVNVSALGAKSITKNGTTALAAGDIASGAIVIIEYDGTQFQLISGVANAVLLAGAQTITGEKTFTGLPHGIANSICDGRLTGTSGTPVTTTDVTAIETLYFTPYKGNRITVYDGTTWKLYTFSELSIDIPDVTGVHDVFIYDNAGTLTLEVLVWTNDTTRATALTLQNGVLVKTGVTTRRYLGTFYSTTAGNGQTENSAANVYIWNYYNRLPRKGKAVDATNSWTYTTAAYQQANASTANQVNFVIGYAEDVVEATVLAVGANSSGSVAFVAGIGLDSSTVNSADLAGLSRTAGSNVEAVVVAKYSAVVAVGRHSLRWLEYSEATGATTWLGDGGVTGVQCGITATIWA